ncbi:hypothetical protein [Enterococcus sp. AZ196]
MNKKFLATLAWNPLFRLRRLQLLLYLSLMLNIVQLICYFAMIIFGR